MREHAQGDRTVPTNALVHKRAQLSGEIARVEANLVRLRGDLEALDRVLGMTGLTIRPETIPPIVRPWAHLAKELAEMKAFALDMLGKSSEPLRNAVLTRAWMEAKEIPGVDIRTVEFHRTRMCHALRYLRKYGKVEAEKRGPTTFWRLVSTD